MTLPLFLHEAAIHGIGIISAFTEVNIDSLLTTSIVSGIMVKDVKTLICSELLSEGVFIQNELCLTSADSVAPSKHSSFLAIEETTKMYFFTR